MAKARPVTAATVMRLAAGLAADIQHAVACRAVINTVPITGTRTAMLLAWCETQQETFHSGVAARALGLRREFCANTFREWKDAGYLVASGTLNCGQSHGTVLYRRKG